ncbi:NUDIX domain-containing protein [Salipiger sp. PrR003]|uniref:YunG family protein n=1 Tax=Salipiger sp. PrR003 TaxID=2706776 RepID=UPI0013D9AC00|nr:NUDIX domain-containing protein [Salipiger sp. PrR003]NDV50778.1 NUDIX domain-containing protein [Salipiger sp. PrR003]
MSDQSQAANLNGLDEPKSTDRTHIEVISEGLAYKGFFKIRTLRYRFRMFDGSLSGELTREVADRGNAVAVLPYDPQLDCVALIRQHLAGNIVADVPNRPLQVIAGMVETNELPKDVAVREAFEEAGLTLEENSLKTGPTFMPSPGGSSEVIHTFTALTDLAGAQDQGIFGLVEEHEDIRLEIVPALEAIRMLDEGEITAGPAVVLLSWFARHREKMLQDHQASITQQKVFDLVKKSWCRLTAQNPDDWAPEAPYVGQCAVTACLLYEQLGLPVVRGQAFLPDGTVESHYWNEGVDLTGRQYPQGTIFKPRHEGPQGERAYVYVRKNPNAEKRLKVLRAGFELLAG